MTPNMNIPLAHGVDLVELSDFEEILEKTGERFIARIFTPAEQEYCFSQKQAAASFAARFAAKEAVSKALGTGIGSQAAFQEIEVIRNPETGEPGITLHGNAKDTARKKGITRWLVSLSHTGKTALASVIGF